MLIGIPMETTVGESRVAVTPETVKKLKAQGHTLRVQSGAGVAASVTDEAYVAAGAEITDAAGAFGADMVLKGDAANSHLIGGKIHVLPQPKNSKFGKYVLSPRDGTFSLRAGPVFANAVLADEDHGVGWSGGWR